jgi:DNA replication protein DnaC
LDQGGYIRINDEGIEVYKACQCLIKKRTERIFKASHITDGFANKTFEKFDLAYLPNVVRDAHRCAMKYSDSFDKIRTSKQNSISLIGKSGAGKTHLLMAIANRLISKNVPLIYFPYVEGFNEIKNDLDNLESRVSKLQRIDVLFIDDLYKGRKDPTPFVIEQLFGIINYRYMNNLPVLISSERFMNEMLDIDEAIGSRIFEMTRDFRVELSGADLNYRLREEE